MRAHGATDCRAVQRVVRIGKVERGDLDSVDGAVVNMLNGPYDRLGAARRADAELGRQEAQLVVGAKDRQGGAHEQPVEGLADGDGPGAASGLGERDEARGAVEPRARGRVAAHGV